MLWNKKTRARFMGSLGLIAGLSVGAAQAAYLQWETVELPASSGASCGNGTPYRFFVNRTPFTSKTVVVFEGGGACFGQNTCLGLPLPTNDPKNGVLLALNPDGIPPNYMSSLVNTNAHTSGSPLGLINTASFGMVTPFTNRLGLVQKVQTQGWNIVYAPYCTGDIGGGNATVVYTDANPAKPLAYYHRGAVNGQLMAQWLGKNLARPDQLFVTGFSAGGYASTLNYLWLKQALNPKRSALLNDAGPLLDAPANATPEQAPTLPLYNRVRKVWGIDGPNGIVAKIQAAVPNSQQYGLDPSNFGSVMPALARMFPQDRIAMSTMMEDRVLPRFIYEPFFPDILQAPPGAGRDALIMKRWKQDVNAWVSMVQTTAPSNLGYYIPNARDIALSHTLTCVTFAGTAIPELNMPSVGSFIDDLIDGSRPVMRAQTSVQTTQRSGLAAIYLGIADLLLAVLGA